MKRHEFRLYGGQLRCTGCGKFPSAAPKQECTGIYCYLCLNSFEETIAAEYDCSECGSTAADDELDKLRDERYQEAI